MNYLDELDYIDLKDYDNDDYNNDIFELRTLSKNEFNKLLKTIEETIEKAKKNKQ